MTATKKGKKPERQELTSGIAKACLTFLKRSDLKGSEAETMVIVQQVISGYL